MKENEEKSLPLLNSFEIFCFNSYICLNIIIILYIIILIMPEDLIVNLFGLRIFPQKYWFIAIPTHILTTLLGLTICIKAFELIRTIDNPPMNDLFYHELPEEEMMKEIDFSPSEGILPDAGDINYEIVQKVINMDDDNNDEDSI